MARTVEATARMPTLIGRKRMRECSRRTALFHAWFFGLGERSVGLESREKMVTAPAFAHFLKLNALLRRQHFMDGIDRIFVDLGHAAGHVVVNILSALMGPLDDIAHRLLLPGGKVQLFFH